MASRRLCCGARRGGRRRQLGRGGGTCRRAALLPLHRRWVRPRAGSPPRGPARGSRSSRRWRARRFRGTCPWTASACGSRSRRRARSAYSRHSARPPTRTSAASPSARSRCAGRGRACERARCGAAPRRALTRGRPCCTPHSSRSTDRRCSAASCRWRSRTRVHNWARKRTRGGSRVPV